VRGLRTLRHLEAHIDSVPTTRHIALLVGPPNADGDSRSVLEAGAGSSIASRSGISRVWSGRSWKRRSYRSGSGRA
jgi:hypothetical protein